MQAVILAAGMGKRLKELTRDCTKCMVKVGGVMLIDRMLRQLDRQRLSRIVIVTGYEGQKLTDHVRSLELKTPVFFIQNPVYDKTNNIYSLSLAGERLREEDTILLESDIIFEDSVLSDLIADPRETLALVDRYEPWMEGTCVEITPDERITRFVSKKDFQPDESAEYYKTVNLYKFSREFSESCYLPFLSAYRSVLGENEYYEEVLRVISMVDDSKLRVRKLSCQKWFEIDDSCDLAIAETLFAADGSTDTEKLNKSYGGYWRYPNLLDFCYPVNPYFPPESLKKELAAASSMLLTRYPSGMHGNCLLAAAIFDLEEKNVIVGNGAAELIRNLTAVLDGKTGFVRPVFEEYPNRLKKDLSVCFTPGNRDFSYTAEDLIRFFDSSDIRNLVLVNPDNPSGNCLTKAELLSLAGWSQKKKIRLVIDESFAGFAEENVSLLSRELLSRYPQLFIIKSLSKSHGIPGLRLGILASGDTEAIESLKKDSAIWNINSFAEFYMQIVRKYTGQYETSLRKTAEERKKLAEELAALPGIRVCPSRANYLMVETETHSSGELTQLLLQKHHILVKDLSDKLDHRSYLRIAVRNEADNALLIRALRDCLIPEDERC